GARLARRRRRVRGDRGRGRDQGAGARRARRAEGGCRAAALGHRRGAARARSPRAGGRAPLAGERIGPVAVFKTAAVVARLPKTRSGKILRGTMRRIADGEESTVAATIDGPAILAEIEGALAGVGYARTLQGQAPA